MLPAFRLLVLTVPLAVCAVASPVSVSASANHGSRIPEDASRITHLTLPTKTATLANGLKVVLHEDHRTPIVAVNLWYGVGSKDEPKGRHGFAHLFEHLMFQGSKHVAEDAYFHYLERAGASNINGTTGPDRTNYFETVPRNRLELALWLESDRMGFLLDHVNEETLASQREVVKNERRQNYENAPYGLVDQYVDEALFPPNHPYHHLTIGSPADLDAATLDDVRRFFRTFYVPGNATLAVGGDIDPAVAFESIEKYFGPIPGGDPPPRQTVDGPGGPAREVRLDVDAGVELARVEVSWVTPPYFAPGDGELDLLARAMAFGKTSRLYKRLVYDEQIAADVAAYQESGELASKFEIVATAKTGHHPDELLAEIDQELDKVRAAPITDEELARATTSFLSARAFALEGMGSRAETINTFLHYTGDPGYLPRDIARYTDATAAGIRETVGKWLVPGARVVTFVHPVKGAPLAGRKRSL